MRKLSVMILILAVLPLAATAARKAQNESAEDSFRFGLKLFDDQEYFRAVTEFERYRFLLPESPKAEEALRRVAVSCYDDKKWKAAEKSLREYGQAYPKAAWAEQAEFFLAESLYEQSRISKPAPAGAKEGERSSRIEAEKESAKARRDEARERYRQFTQQRTASPMYNLALARLGLLELENRNWVEAGNWFDKLAASPLKDSYQALGAGLALESRSGAELGAKSRALAVAASAVIPGAGQAYAGQWHAAAVDFILVGGLAGWSAWYASEKQSTGAVVVGVLAGIGYLGNLRNAFRAVERSNLEQPEQRVKKITDEINAVTAPQPEVMLPLLRLGFR